MDKEHIKNKLTDVGMYIRSNTSIIFYIFIAVVVLSYASLYTYKTYIQTEASTIPQEEKFKEFSLNNNIIQMVENEYNKESGFYVAKFVIKNRNADTPVIANDTLNVSGIARLKDNELHELNIEAKQITPTFFVVEAKNLPNNHVELRLDFELNSFSLENDNVTDETSLYSFVTEKETKSNLKSLSNKGYEEQAYRHEIDMVNEQIASLEEEIDYYNERINTLEEQIEDSKTELDMMTKKEKQEMEATIATQYSEIESYEEEINDVNKSIAEREEKRSLIKESL